MRGKSGCCCSLLFAAASVASPTEPPHHCALLGPFWSRLVLGSAGNVGAGIASAFRKADWKVIGVDSAFTGPESFHGGDECFASSTEAMPDNWLLASLRKCSYVVYAAENGQRDDYETNSNLGESNNQRFRYFCERCVPCGGLGAGGSCPATIAVSRVCAAGLLQSPHPAPPESAVLQVPTASSFLLEASHPICWWLLDEASGVRTRLSRCEPAEASVAIQPLRARGMIA